MKPNSKSLNMLSPKLKLRWSELAGFPKNMDFSRTFLLVMNDTQDSRIPTIFQDTAPCQKSLWSWVSASTIRSFQYHKIVWKHDDLCNVLQWRCTYQQLKLPSLRLLWASLSRNRYTITAKSVESGFWVSSANGKGCLHTVIDLRLDENDWYHCKGRQRLLSILT